jgi:hypothetical protein
MIMDEDINEFDAETVNEFDNIMSSITAKETLNWM